MRKSANVIVPDFPTPLERKLLDLPLPEDDDCLVIPFDSRACVSPVKACKTAAPAMPPFARGRRYVLREFWAAWKIAAGGILAAVVIGLPFLAFYVMG